MPRPKVVIDEARLEELAASGASVNEMALILGVDDMTLHRRFAKLISKKKAERRVSIRNAQTREAMAGNPTLLIWLGKVELKQSEQPERAEQDDYDVDLGGEPQAPHDPAYDADAAPA